MPKQSLLIIVDWFAPGFKAGGPIRSSLNVALALADDYLLGVLTTDTDHGEKEPYSSIASNEWVKSPYRGIPIYYANKQTLKIAQLKTIIVAANADFVYLNHVWSPLFVLYPLWLKYTGQIKSKVILCPRGGLYDSALGVKRYKKMPLLRLMRWMKMHQFVTFHATNQREKLAIHRFFPKGKVIIADNLPSNLQPEFKTIEKRPGNLKCVFIARVVPIKNLLFLLKALRNVVANVQLTIVGPVEDVPYWNECEAYMKQLPSNIRISNFGPKENSQLAAILEDHHLFTLPTTGENFGHSIFEAFLSGRPVLISDQTPWRNLEDKGIGWDLQLDDPQLFTNAISQMADFTQEQFDTAAYNAWQYAKEYIANADVKKAYLNLFS